MSSILGSDRSMSKIPRPRTYLWTASQRSSMDQLTSSHSGQVLQMCSLAENRTDWRSILPPFLRYSDLTASTAERMTSVSSGP